jgi:hypothetical protein
MNIHEKYLLCFVSNDVKNYYDWGEGEGEGEGDVWKKNRTMFTH